MNGVTAQIVTVLTAIVGVAVIAVLVSKRADTANVINAAGKNFTGALNAAVSPLR